VAGSMVLLQKAQCDGPRCGRRGVTAGRKPTAPEHLQESARGKFPAGEGAGDGLVAVAGPTARLGAHREARRPLLQCAGRRLKFHLWQATPRPRGRLLSHLQFPVSLHLDSDEVRHRSDDSALFGTMTPSRSQTRRDVECDERGECAAQPPCPCTANGRRGRSPREPSRRHQRCTTHRAIVGARPGYPSGISPPYFTIF